MRPIDKMLAEWKASLCESVDIGGLYSRNPIAHKWKAPYRSLTLREIVAWRTQDLLEQSLLLYETNHILGARILLRSAFETISALIYLNQLTRKVLSGKLDFHEYSKKTAILLLGSRDCSTMHTAINIVTVIEKCDARYPGLKDLYASLSESAHPNYEGTCIGYSIVDKNNDVATFSNRWKEMYGKNHIQNIDLCSTIFYCEYNEEWPDVFEKLEVWIEQNDDKLEATKKGV